SGTVRLSTSPSPWSLRTPKPCSSGMPEEITGDGAFRVLVADDNEVAQRLCKRVLEKAGYPVLIAADGLQAVDIALNHRPAMILMAVAMPATAGLEPMRRSKPEIPAIPIVMP